MKGVVRFKERLAPYTTLRIGGEADRLFIPKGVAELAAFLRSCPPQEPLTVLGWGSNVLVSDRGIRGTVVVTKGLNWFRTTGDVARVGGGLKLARLLHDLARVGLGGMAFMTGIPGTVGGAIRMNAGTAEGVVSDRLISLTALDRKGTVHRCTRQEVTFGYRHASLPRDWVIVGAEFGLERGEPHVIREAMRERLTARKASQPLSMPSAGSVFKNPSGVYAGALIEAAGLKGLRAGNAQVSPVHGNFIVNCGDATAADVMGLIDRIRKKVKKKFSIQLELEIELLGEFDGHRQGNEDGRETG
ncbi:MAG: UDP-N-acetylmuramate dehydrogenase [bacterium]|nr:UDP-N-acetylmuramate dehydrogenase [bacterium]